MRRCYVGCGGALALCAVTVVGCGGDLSDIPGKDTGAADTDTTSPQDLCEAVGWTEAVDPDEAFGTFEGTFLMGTEADCTTDRLRFLTATTYRVTVAPADRSITVTHEDGEMRMEWDDREDLACHNANIEGALIIRVAQDADHSFGVHNVADDAVSLIVKDGSVNPGCSLIQQV